MPGAPSGAIEGTSAASIIAGHGDSVGQASGIIGVAPAARILSIRVVLDATDPLNANPADVGRLPTAIAAGIRYAAGHGAQVIDLPLDPASLASDGAATGGLSAAAGGSAAERAAVNYALGKGSVLVAPAGDNGENGNEPAFPASYPGVIALGAVDRHFVRAPFSNRQSYVALTAPGVNLTTASPPSGYRNMSTTDAASAIVAGVAALIRSRYPALTGSQVRQALLAGGAARPPSATTPGDGAGTVDALKAVEAAALITAPRAAASAPSSSPAKAQAPPGKIRPAEGHPATGILSRAKAGLRDAAMAAGVLIVLLLASLIGIRVRRRRAERATLPAPEPRTLLSAPSGPLARRGAAYESSRGRAGCRSACGGAGSGPVENGATPSRRPGLADPSPPVRPGRPPGQPGQLCRVHRKPWPLGRQPHSARTRCTAFPGPGIARWPGSARATRGSPIRRPDPGPHRPGQHRPGQHRPGQHRPGRRSSRRENPPEERNRGRSGGRSGASSRVSAHGLPVRVTPVPRTVTRAEVSAPGGPPWDPAPMPEGEVPHDPVQRAPDPFALFAPSAPATSAPWDADQPGPVADPGPIAPPGHTAPPPGHVARSEVVPPHNQAAPPGRPAPMVPPQPDPPHRRGQFDPGGVPGSSVPGGDAPGCGDPGSPVGAVPPGPAMPGGPVPPEGRLPLVRPSRFAGASRPPEPPRSASPAVPPPTQRETAEASGQPDGPDHPPGPVRRIIPRPGLPAAAARAGAGRPTQAGIPRIPGRSRPRPHPRLPRTGRGRGQFTGRAGR